MGCQTLDNLVNPGLSPKASPPMFLFCQHRKMLCTLDPEFFPDSYRGEEKTLLKFKTSWVSLAQIPSLSWTTDLCSFRRSFLTPDSKYSPWDFMQTWVFNSIFLGMSQVPLPTNALLVSLGLSGSFPPLKHPCGCTINVDISPEQDVFEKIF